MRNATINGAGHICEGTYDNITINGAGKFDGAITCDELVVNGACKGYDITSNVLKIAGAITADNITANNVEISGSCKANKIKADKFASHGSLNCESIESDCIENSGAMKCDDVKARDILLNGVGSNIKTITCDYLHVKKSGIILFAKNNKITSITGKSINVTYCDVETIVGDDVVIGPHCNIKEVTYTSTLNVDKHSKVDNIIFN